MKRALAVLACVVAVSGGLYMAASKLAIRHQTLDLFDAKRQRPIAVALTVRRDIERDANDGGAKLPVAIISNGNTLKNTEYSFLENVLAARGYLVASIQQDLPTDPPLVTNVNMPYVGRLDVYKRGEANILFVVNQLKTMQPNADYDHLTLVGHSNGGDIAMFCAKDHPDIVSKVITLDNLRVPFVLNDKMKIISFRSTDPNFKADPGVLPTPEQAKAEGIDIIKTPFRHNWMSDRGPDEARDTIQTALNKFLGELSSDLSPVTTDDVKIGAGPYP